MAGGGYLGGATVLCTVARQRPVLGWRGCLPHRRLGPSWLVGFPLSAQRLWGWGSHTGRLRSAKGLGQRGWGGLWGAL